MTTEIEKLYNNAGVNKFGNKKCTPAEFLDCQNYCFISENNKCDKFSYDYPPFTAEKQIELIKWLLQNKRLCIRKAEYSNNFYMDTIFNRLDGVDNKDFEQCLASLVNNIWQDLTEEEKQQVKGILE